MHSSLPLLALSLLGALVSPTVSVAQQTADPVQAEPETKVLPAEYVMAATQTVPKSAPLPATPVATPAAVAPAETEAPAAAPGPEAAGAEKLAPAKPATKVLAGNVVDEWGKPLVGATVMILGQKEHSVSTNAEGDYLLPTTAVAPVLQVSYAGYLDAERIARGPADLLFKLEPVNDYKKDLKKRSKAAEKAWKH